VIQIKSGLKQRWEILNNEYLKYAHVKKPDTQIMMKKFLLYYFWFEALCF